MRRSSRLSRSKRSQKRKHKRHATRAKRGLAPGTLIYVGAHLGDLKVTITRYSDEEFSEQSYHQLEELEEFDFDHLSHLTEPSVIKTWINVEGISDPRVVEFFGEKFGIHSLVLEDILNTEQRPKLEEYDDYLFVTIKSISLNSTDEPEQQEIEPSILELNEEEQLSFLLFKNVLITFRERSDELFDQLKERLQHSGNRVRKEGCDYLFYALMDRVVDEYFEGESRLEIIIEGLEDRLFEERYGDIRHLIQQLRREVMSLKRHCVPLLNIVSQAPQLSSILIQEPNLRYFNDVQDHLFRVVDALDADRERVRGLQDLYLASLSNKMNETMKVLTIFSTIFIPLTFIAGIYGMNFEHMPELKWRWAYPTLWVVFIVITLSLLRFFKRRDWF